MSLCRREGVRLLQREITRLGVGTAAIKEEVVVVFLLTGDADNKEGQRVSASNGVRRGRGSGSSRVRRAAGSSEGWLRSLATVGQGCDRGGCRGKKMRRARLEATVAASGDGCSLRLRLHDGEEKWATVTRLRAGRQQRQGKRRRQRGFDKGSGGGWQGLRLAEEEGGGQRQSSEGCGSGRAEGSDRWRQWQGGETAMRAGSRGGGGLHGEDGEDSSNKGRGGRGQRQVAVVAGDRSRRVWPVVGCGCGRTAATENRGGVEGSDDVRLLREAAAEAEVWLRLWLRRRGQRRCVAAKVRRTVPYRRTEIWLVRYDWYVPPVSGGMKNLGGCCSRKEEEGSDSSVRAAGEGGGCGVSVRSAQRWLRLRAREAATEAVLVGGRSRGERRGLCLGGAAAEEEGSGDVKPWWVATGRHMRQWQAVVKKVGWKRQMREER
ncbi:hypothetical protein BHM03_00046063 [Ensete ventricosum]|nr:hypothetical protein BHM03_00046063 [Ensete ventricosum]